MFDYTDELAGTRDRSYRVLLLTLCILSCKLACGSYTLWCGYVCPCVCLWHWLIDWSVALALELHS